MSDARAECTIDPVEDVNHGDAVVLGRRDRDCPREPVRDDSQHLNRGGRGGFAEGSKWNAEMR